MKNFDSKKSLIFVGDHHGAWGSLFDEINNKNIKDCSLVSVGDLGVGFKYKRELEYSSFEELDKEFKKRNINFYGIRGNHDDPFYFQGDEKTVLENFELVKDYAVAEYNGLVIQFIGGAISIDRESRVLNHSYWEDEKVNLQISNCKDVDVLITHTCPSYCFPQAFNEIVYSWAREDAYLIEDLTNERRIVDEIFKICQPKFHVYGHFHNSHIEQIGNCTHKLLNIEEFYEFRN